MSLPPTARRHCIQITESYTQITVLQIRNEKDTFKSFIFVTDQNCKPYGRNNKIESIDQYDQLFGLETLHPLVNVIDFSKATKTVDYYRMNIGFYSLFLKDAKCGDLRYGRKYYDYQEGTVVCMAPGQVIGIDNRKQTPIRTNLSVFYFIPI